ncbi:hypothetical protein [Vitiosangium sp. GDMCC 1.1324]|uniref:hypothetical protein n=1 Tax=Vitiosangium sp. (strain GDMCC 1.1324) TaxID=2138576 RepID=UPI0011B85128|nr:hypothetical protein [Vitiosangium sp. GDMCC 1.1324]
MAAGISGLLPAAGRAEGGPPANVMFLVDNNASMQEYSEYLPEAFTPGYYPTPEDAAPGDLGGDGPAGYNINTGCSDPALVAAMSWFDKDSSDPAKNGSISVDDDPTLGSKFFEPDKFYHSRGRRLAWQTEEYPYSLSSFFNALNSHGDVLTACYTVTNWKGAYFDSPMMNECMACLQTKGWWRGPVVSALTEPGLNGPTQNPGDPPLPPEAFRKWVISGRVLNVRPPKFVVARKATKDAIAQASNVRMGVATLGRDQGWFDPPELLKGMSPSCTDSTPAINESALDRAGLKQAVNQIQFRNQDRHIGEALFGLGGYFSSQTQDNRWGSWFAQPINPSWGWPGCCDGGTYDNPYTGQPGATWAAAPDEWLKAPYVDEERGIYLPGQPWEPSESDDKSICFDNQSTAVVVVTGGTPRYEDNSVPITRMMELLKAQGARHPDGSLVRFNPTDPEHNPDVGGINYCNEAVKYPPASGTYTQADCDYTDYNWPHGLGVGNKNFMDDVAFFLSHMDLRGDIEGSESVRTFVVGYGTHSPMLQSIAKAGQGGFYRANNGTELRSSLTTIIGGLSAP